MLLDEVNLASAETLQALGPLLESPTGSVILSDRGSVVVGGGIVGGVVGGVVGDVVVVLLVV